MEITITNIFAILLLALAGWCAIMTDRTYTKRQNGNWITIGGETVNKKHIVHISENPNGTLNIHLSNGRAVNTSITDINKLLDIIG